MQARLATTLLLLGSVLGAGTLAGESQDGLDDLLRSAIRKEDSAQSTINISPSGNLAFTISYNWDGGVLPAGALQSTNQVTIIPRLDSVRLGGKSLKRGVSYALFLQDLHSSPTAVLFQKDGQKIGALESARVAPRDALFSGFSANVQSKNGREGLLYLLDTKQNKQGGIRIPVSW